MPEKPSKQKRNVYIIHDGPLFDIKVNESLAKSTTNYCLKNCNIKDVPNEVKDIVDENDEDPVFVIHTGIKELVSLSSEHFVIDAINCTNKLKKDFQSADIGIVLILPSVEDDQKLDTKRLQANKALKTSEELNDFTIIKNGEFDVEKIYDSTTKSLCIPIYNNITKYINMFIKSMERK